MPREKLDAHNNLPLSKATMALKFQTTHIQADPMSENDGIKMFVYPFENTGSDTVTVKRLVATCSCISAQCRNRAIAPGESSEIVVKYNPKGHPGRFERKVFIYTEDEQTPSVILRLSVDVDRGGEYAALYPVSMGNIRVRRNEIKLNAGIKAIEKCSFVNVSGKPLKLECEQAMLPPCLTFKTQPEVVEDGQEGEIVITYDPSKDARTGKMPVMLKNMGLPPSQSTIVVEIL